MEKNEKGINGDYIIQSLQMQISESIMKIAERDALITEHHEKIVELEKELEGYREKEIKEMDKDAE